jgi:anti-anti-sigma factor
MVPVLDRPATPATVRVIGQLRAPGTSALRRAVTALLLDGERHILLDLAALTDLDAAGIGELVYVSNMTTNAGGTLQISRARTSVRRLLDGVGLLPILEDTSTVSDRAADEGSSSRHEGTRDGDLAGDQLLRKV